MIDSIKREDLETYSNNTMIQIILNKGKDLLK